MDTPNISPRKIFNLIFGDSFDRHSRQMGNNDSQCSHEKNGTTFEHHACKEPQLCLFLLGRFLKVYERLYGGECPHKISRTILKMCQAESKIFKVSCAHNARKWYPSSRESTLAVIITHLS